MATKYISILVLLVVVTCCMSLECNKIGIGCANSTYSFQINARVYPDNDSIKIGDTIWVEINSPDTFTDQRSSQVIDFSNANNLGTDMGFSKLINASPIKLSYAVNDFNFVLISGKEEASDNPTLLKNYLITENNHKYYFKLGVIPKDSGSYSFNLGNFAGVYRNNNPCPKADFYTRLTETDQHYYLYPGGNNVTPAGADYYFYVK